MWMFSHSHTLESQKYAHARDWMQHSRMHMRALMFACTVLSLPTLTHRRNMRTLWQQVNTLRAERKNLSSLSSVKDAKAEMPIYLSSLSFITLVHSYIHADVFRYSMACNNLKLAPSAIPHTRKSQEKTEKEERLNWWPWKWMYWKINWTLVQFSVFSLLTLHYGFFLFFVFYCLSFFIYICFSFQPPLFLSSCKTEGLAKDKKKGV